MAAERFDFEDFELDRSAYELRRAGSVVHLERIPLDLLFLLIERRGKLVTRQEIFERIWGKNVFLDVDNSINIAVRKLRNALHDDPDAPRFVVTVPAKGYRFIAPIREEGPTAPVPAAGLVSAVPEASPTADAVDPSSTTITKADMPLQKERRRGILWSIGGIALVIAVIVLIEQVSLRQPTTTASFPPAQPPALTLPDKPSIAVLPFTNMSGDREQEYFSDGITDDLITALSRLPDLFVIARTSTLTYKGKAAKVQDIGRELGVAYILEGSVRKASANVRITAQLVDATTGDHLWAEHYDRPLKEIFSLQDEIVRRIVTTLNLQLGLWERHGMLESARTDNIEAYDDVLRGWAYLWTETQQGVAKAMEMFQKAVDLDPKYADAYAGMGWTYFWDWGFQWNRDPQLLDRALELGRQAIALDDSETDAYALLSVVETSEEQYDRAIADSEHAIALDPNYTWGYVRLADALIRSGRPADGIGWAEKVMRLDPRNRNRYFLDVGLAYFAMGRYEESVSAYKQSLVRWGNNPGPHLGLAVDYVELGRDNEARAETAEILRFNPRFSPHPVFKDPVLKERYIADLRKAGLK